MKLNTEMRKTTDPIYQKVSKVIPEIEWAFHAPLIHKIKYYYIIKLKVS